MVNQQIMVKKIWGMNHGGCPKRGNNVAVSGFCSITNPGSLCQELQMVSMMLQLLETENPSNQSSDEVSSLSQAGQQKRSEIFSLEIMQMDKRASIAKLFEQVGLQKFLSLLESEDTDVPNPCRSGVANLAAEDKAGQKVA
ncbi:hypothetical protein HPP92_028711 [Vanilla planifolia]|uniref:Uncharacterized protein n=1 Tax=Vanilla planifolia TaxID=51239 RepID=A0A835P6P8_VANPL|nr:hypothetical protein HPP92_028711 [Vanilla planifolia]KAG0446718.1 hypothetical protein HPP92_028694 [Vanilla planifolia]